jgi:hypothetical protein
MYPLLTYEMRHTHRGRTYRVEYSSLPDTGDGTPEGLDIVRVLRGRRNVSNTVRQTVVCALFDAALAHARANGGRFLGALKTAPAPRRSAKKAK